MELLTLRYFRSIARHEHLTRAAAELHVSQPALSRALGRLEDELGAPLFDRRGRGLHLNRVGRGFLARVERALGEIDAGAREVAETTGLEQGAVTLAAETLRPVADALAAFLARHPQVEVSVHQATPARMVTELRRGEIDMAFLSQPVPAGDLPDLEVRELRTEEVVLALPRGHRLAGGLVEPGDLVAERWVTTTPGLWPRAVLAAVFDDLGASPSIACESDEPTVLRALVAAGLGSALLPAEARTAEAGPPVAWARVDSPRCRRVLRLAWRPAQHHSRAARRFHAAAVRRLTVADP